MMDAGARLSRNAYVAVPWCLPEHGSAAADVCREEVQGGGEGEAAWPSATEGIP